MKKITSILIIMLFIITALAVSSDTMIKENPYNGRLRIYAVEIESRYNMYNGEPYHYALIDMPYDENLSLDYLETFEESFNWQGDVMPNNLIIIAAVFNPEANTNYANPPIGAPFNAYYVDAAAGTTPGSTSSNTVTEDFTHTVFIEKGTGTFCPSCPAVGEALSSIYESEDYPFFYVSMVVDVNEVADIRMEDYNLYWVPTLFCDGGNEVLVGPSENEIRNAIESSGQRDVHELDLILSSEHLGRGEIKINVSVTNIENYPPEKPDKPTGVEQGKPDVEYNFSTSTSDLENDDIYYMWDWGDENLSEWLGPYSPGDTCEASYTWASEGEYQIRVKAKDDFYGESEWSDPLAITMPKNKAINTPFQNFIEQHPFLFPLLRQMLRLG
jgi:hypothetical protein